LEPSSSGNLAFAGSDNSQSAQYTTTTGSSSPSYSNALSALQSNIAALANVMRGIVSIIPALHQQSPALDTVLQEQLTALQTEISQTNRITQLPASIVVSGVSGLTESDIPDLSDRYVKAGGGSSVSGLSQFVHATSSLLSVYGPTYFGSTATSTFGTDGSLTLSGLGTWTSGFISQASSTVAGNFAVTGNTSFGSMLAAGTTTINSLVVSNTSTSTFSGGLSVLNFNQTGSASSTFTRGINLAAGCFAINNACLSLGNVSGTLATNQGGTGWTNISTGSILFGNGPSAIATSSNLYWDNSNNRLSIGTTTPAATLSVSGNGYLTGGFGVGVLNTNAGTISASTSYAIGTHTIITLPQGSAASFNSYSNVTLGLGAGTNAVPGTGLDYLTAAGYNAAQSVTTADHITAIGAFALNEITDSTGSHNSGFGIDTMRFMTSGTWNTAVGEQSLNRTTSANSDTSVGSLAMLYSGGAFNTAVGSFALAGSSTYPMIGQGNTAIGYEAFINSAGNANCNTAIGEYALANATTTTNDTALGYNTGIGLLSGNYNTLLGSGVGNSAPTTGSANILIGFDYTTDTAFGYSNGAIGIGQWAKPGTNDLCIGYSACKATSQDNNANTAYGYGALSGDTNGSQNAAFGFEAGSHITGGYYNTVLGGDSAATTLTTGHDNILLGTPGNKADTPTSNANYYLDIGNIIYGTSINSAGSVGIGTSTPYSRLEIWGPDTASTSAFTVVNSASTTVFAVYDSGNSTYSGSIFQSSDQRLKTNIQSLDGSSGLSAIEALNPVSYTRLDQPELSENFGFIAQQVGSIFPQLVSTTSATTLTPDGTLTLNYTGLIAPIVAAVKEIANISGDFEHNLISWLGSATNGISDLYAGVFHGREADVQKLCVGETCINDQQLAALLESRATSGQGSATSSANSVTSLPSIPPVIQINGDNPATIAVGAAYRDLGATIVGPTADLNLGIHTFVGEIPIDEAIIDTSTTTTYYIYYVVTDQNGLTSTSTRTVIVE
jgi:hypothetical protein